MLMQPTILLVDDHTLLREGLQVLIEKFALGTVIGQAGDGAEAVRLAGELRPDLVIMDITMPIMNGIDATREIIKNNPDAKILVISMESDRSFVVEVLRAGAMGYLLKDTLCPELEVAISAVSSGRTYLPQKIETLLVKEFLQCIPEDLTVTYETLTSRERKILQHVADGKSLKEIGFLLNICAKTVDNHRYTIMSKLNIFNIADLTKYAVRHGITSLTI
jgi:DNA-binding NarL/FixJ family response regulator